jgi:hypothetical protein
MTMTAVPPSPEQFAAAANAANQQAANKKQWATQLRDRGERLAPFLDRVMGGMGMYVWVGGAANTCHHEAEARRKWMQTVNGHLHNYAQQLDRDAAALTQKATACQQAIGSVTDWQTRCAQAAAQTPPGPQPPPPQVPVP